MNEPAPMPQPGPADPELDDQDPQDLDEDPEIQNDDVPHRHPATPPPRRRRPRMPQPMRRFEDD